MSFLLLLLVLPPAASCPSSCCLLSFLLKAFTKHKKRSRWSVSFALTPSRPVVALAMAEIASGVPSWEISASEPEGVNMPSNLDNVLAAKGMRRVAVPGDGNCQFAAVLTSMDLAGLEVTMTPQQLRKKAVKYLKAHRSQFSDHAWLPGDSCSVRLLLLLPFPSSWCLLSFLLLRLVLLPGVSCPSSCCLLSFLLLLPVLPPAASCASCPSSFCFLFGHLASSAGRRTWRECSSLVSTATTAPCKQLRKLPSSALRCTRAVLRSRRWRLRHPPAAASIQLLWHSCRSIIMMRWKLFLWCRPVCFLLSFLLLCLAPFCPSSCIVCPSSFSLALLSLSSQTPVAPVIAADKSEAEEEDPPLALVAAAEEDLSAGHKRRRQEDAGLQKKPATSRAAGYDLRNQELPKRRLACKKATFLLFILCLTVDILSFLRFLLVLPLSLSCHFSLCLLPVLSSWARSATKKPSSQAKRTGSYAQSRAARLTAAAIRMSCGSPRRKGCIGRASGGS